MAEYFVYPKLGFVATVPDGVTSADLDGLFDHQWWNQQRNLMRDLYPKTGPPSGRSPVDILWWHIHSIEGTIDEAN